MYYGEKMIDGIMHYQTDPDGPWIPYDMKQLSFRYDMATRHVQQLLEKVMELQKD